MADKASVTEEVNEQNEEFVQKDNGVQNDEVNGNTACVKLEVNQDEPNSAQDGANTPVEIDVIYVDNTLPFPAQTRAPLPPSGSFQLCAYVIAYILVFNGLWLIDPQTRTQIAFIIVKMVTGVFGLAIICISSKKFTALKVYAVAVLVVYMACFVVEAYSAEVNRNTQICSEGDVTFPACARRGRPMRRAELIVFAMYGVGAFALTLLYAVHSEQYMREVSQYDKEHESELPPV